MCFIFVQENDQHLVSVRLPWCFSLSHHRKWPTSFFQPHFISKSEQEKNMFLSIQSWILLGICFGMLSRCCPIRCFYPLTNAPQNGQNPYVCHTLSNLVGFCSYYFASQICFFKPHPTCHFYPKYIQIWFHSCCPIYVCSFCMFSLPFFFELPRSSPVACAFAVQNKAQGATPCPVFGTAQREFRGENSGVEKVRFNWGHFKNDIASGWDEP